MKTVGLGCSFGRRYSQARKIDKADTRPENGWFGENSYRPGNGSFIGRCKMEELFELRSCIEQGRYADALSLIGEMEEMSKGDKTDRVRSYMAILLLHLIKRHAQKTTTRSWDISIRNALLEIALTNKRRKARGFYLDKDELKTVLEEAWEKALPCASMEAFEGSYSETELAGMIDEKEIKEEALRMVLDKQREREA
jgi:hypothetical protein